MQNPSDIELALRRVPLFCDLSAGVLKALSQEAVPASYGPKNFLFKASDKPDHLHVLFDGTVKMTTSSLDGRETIIELLQPVDCFLMAAVLTSKPYLMSAQAITDVEVLLVPSALLRQLVSDESQLALTMVASLANQYRQMVRHVKDLRLRTAAQRLGIYLLGLVEKGDSNTLALPFVKKLIAARLHMTPESMSRAIVTLRNEGVDVTEDEVHIHDIDALRRFCKVDNILDELEEEFFVLTDR
ncbi:cyclic nucleotide-binding domain-containing protein [Thiohalomonas denitrificans]|uniref:cyclic nucleotide-binding domain-containing protein n=1 Tax=Thiohalomonas denitrificans TaxID=415747 RepID=UPI0026F21DD5|nr:cyclic nucleotide-binding domain-containing protein [Thiohalomonas denitrificans]